jgi:hypothetical protein
MERGTVNIVACVREEDVIGLAYSLSKVWAAIPKAVDKYYYSLYSRIKYLNNEPTDEVI